MKFFKAENTKKKIGDYQIVEYNYMGGHGICTG